jgi:hypothetical protein
METQPKEPGMNSNTLRLLGFIVATLIVALLLIESGDDSELPEAGTLLLPGMRDVANDIDRVNIVRANEEPLLLSREAGQWVVPARDNYPAKIDSIRQVLLAMTDAKAVEAKTANPELYGRLGVDRPDQDLSKGVLVTATAGDAEFSLIFGNVAQSSFRYARVADQDQSWLIDQNPDIPANAGDWLVADIIDIDAAEVSSVSITHPDGESISISKNAREDANFEVADIPEGRELSYSTVANGIGGALNDLDLDDVRAATGQDEVGVITEFTTFDGMTITATTSRIDGESWVSLIIDAGDAPGDEATAMAAKVAGWQYRIAEYKANLLARRWEDILKDQETPE